MTIALSPTQPVSADARRWGAALCLAQDPDEALQALGAAFTDFGFEAVAALRPDASRGVAVGWSMLDGEVEADGDGFAGARRSVLQGLDARVHRWVARQRDLICREDFLSQDEGTYTCFLNLPCDFGRAPWLTKLSVPVRGDRRGASIGLASAEPFELFQDRLADVRFLAELYCTLQGDRDFDGPDDVDTRPALSSQQIACLRWAAAGKTYVDISEILGISTRTVRYHLETARERYGFATVTQTVVQAAKDLDLDPLDPR